MSQQKAVTVWENGTYKVWTATDAYYAQNDEGYLATIPLKESTMKFIIVIKGTTVAEYENIRQDITDQLKAMNMPPFLFARLPADYTEIEVVWIDEDMENEKFGAALKEGMKSQPITKDFASMNDDPLSAYVVK